MGSYEKMQQEIDDNLVINQKSTLSDILIQ